jgi:hypothetical protein
VLSLKADASRVPLVEKAINVTLVLWPLRVCSHLPVVAS